MPPNGKLEQINSIQNPVRERTAINVVELCDAGRYREAAECLKVIDPEECPLAFGMVEVAMGNQEKARDYLTRDDSPTSRVQMAVSYWKSGEIREARDVLKTIPESFDRLLAEAVINEGSPEKVLRILEKANEYQVVPGKQARLHNNRAIALRKLGEHDRANREFEASLYYLEQAKSDYLASSLKNVARVYSQVGEFGRAHELVDRATTLLADEPSSLAQAFDQKALVYLDADNPEAAWGYADKAVKAIERTDQKAIHAEHLITRAKVLSRLGKFTAALGDLDRAESIGAFLSNDQIIVDACNEKRKLADEILVDADIGRIESALRLTTGLRDAAKKLQMDTHQILMRLMKKYAITGKNISHSGIEKRKSK